MRRVGSKSLNQALSIIQFGEPVMKSGAALQASGEAVFVDDIPSPKNCLHGAYIYSAKPLATIRGIKLMPELQLDGMRDIISSKDIPNGGKNIGAKTKFGTEPLFAEEIARCVGEPLAFVIADTRKVADMTANSAIVDYSIENLEPPILCVEDAVEGSSFLKFLRFYVQNKLVKFLLFWIYINFGGIHTHSVEEQLREFDIPRLTTKR